MQGSRKTMVLSLTKITKPTRFSGGSETSCPFRGTGWMREASRRGVLPLFKNHKHSACHQAKAQNVIPFQRFSKVQDGKHIKDGERDDFLKRRSIVRSN